MLSAEFVRVFSPASVIFALPLRTWLEPLLEQWGRAGLLELRGEKMVLTLAGQFWQVNLSQLLQDFLKHMLDAGMTK